MQTERKKDRKTEIMRDGGGEEERSNRIIMMKIHSVYSKLRKIRFFKYFLSGGAAFEVFSQALSI